MAFIRPYRTSDEDDIIHIFRETASPDLKEAGDPTLHYASYNWARPYIMLVPTNCLVIDDGTGRAVGYLLGVPDTRSFVTNYNRLYLPHLRSQGFVPPPPSEGDSDEQNLAIAMQRITWQPEQMLIHDCPNLVTRYPAHLHIDILSDYQGKGWGRKLIEQTLDNFRDIGVPGIHLGKVGSNFGAGKFYAKLGFNRFPEPLDGGVSGEMGKRIDGGIYLVKVL